MDLSFSVLLSASTSETLATRPLKLAEPFDGLLHPLTSLDHVFLLGETVYLVAFDHLSRPELRKEPASDPARLTEVRVSVVPETAHAEHHPAEVRPLLLKLSIEIQGVVR
jgi:hypothetical protein